MPNFYNDEIENGTFTDPTDITFIPNGVNALVLTDTLATLATSLHITLPSVASTAEELIKFSVSDSTTYMSVVNANATDSIFAPGLFVHQSLSETGPAFTNTLRVTDSGTSQAYRINVQENVSNGTVTTKPLFVLENNFVDVISVGAANGIAISIDSLSQVGINTATPTSVLDVAGSFRLRGSTSTSLSGSYDDYDASATSMFRVNPTSDVTFTGFVSGSFAGRMLTISNNGTANIITIKHQSTSSVAANRVTNNGNDIVLYPGDSVTIGFAMGAPGVSRWGVMASNINIKSSTEYSPAQITSDQNDYATTGYDYLRLNTDASRNITGFANGARGKKLIVSNVGSFDIVLKHQNTGSVGANRMILGNQATDVVVLPGSSVTLQYDSVTTRWRLVTDTNIANMINTATSKATPVDADYVGLVDSAASNVLKKLSWANIKATLKTYFDPLYKPALAARVYATVSLANNTARTPSATKDMMIVLTASLQSGIGQTSQVIVEVDNSGGGTFTTITTANNVNAQTVALGSTTNTESITFVVPKTSQYRYVTSGTGTTTIVSHFEIEI